MKEKRKRAPPTKQRKNSQSKKRLQKMGKKYFETVQKVRHRHRVEEKIWEKKTLNNHKYWKQLVRRKKTLSKR